ncbi:hypothetical protein BLNAU_6570 [Blattamonas nauphoetae]|uniref:Uncharacterized protein n=1 Tax=Blattamonas nauphoetae TaxID=2049346 RepID=A0ABQ9Y476_9EUKA|nr:hypothetical protein BLNAU_6570 [Blattamonas nauphoetae]
MQSSTNALIPFPIDSISQNQTEYDPFKSFTAQSEQTFDNQSAVFASLVNMTKDGCHFDDILQDKAIMFLKCLEPGFGDTDTADRLISSLLLSSNEPNTALNDSICILLSSPEKRIVSMTLTLLDSTTRRSSLQCRLQLLKSDLVHKMFATIKPHTLPITENDGIRSRMIWIAFHLLNLANPNLLALLEIRNPSDKHNHLEMVFEKTVRPSSPFLHHAFKNHDLLPDRLKDSILNFFGAILRLCPYFTPALDFVIAHSVSLQTTRCLSFMEDSRPLQNFLQLTQMDFKNWAEGDWLVQRNGKIVGTALLSEGFKDEVEQLMMHDMSYVTNSITQFTHFFGDNSA